MRSQKVKQQKKKLFSEKENKTKKNTWNGTEQSFLVSTTKRRTRKRKRKEKK